MFESFANLNLSKVLKYTPMTENKAVTYSLLAHVRNSGALMKGPIDVFIPLIKRTLHQLNNKDVFKGKSIIEIQTEANSMYSIDFPISVLKIILNQISTEINVDGQINLVVHNDGSFILKPFYFEDFEEKIQESKRDTENLEQIFLDFCKINNIAISDKTSIFDFIDKNKMSISKYLSNHQAPNGHDFTVEAQFVEYFKKVPNVFDIVRRIYLGSIISSFLEYKTENFKQDVELLFDTNFIISLIDLNTPESTHTCKKLIEVGQNLGFKFTILSDTIEEIKALIKKKAEYFTNTFLTKRINPEDIYNACERRNLGTSDLERIVDNVEDIIKSFGINVIPYTENLKSKAKSSVEYENFKKIRSSHHSALHDAIAILYVKEKRKKRIKEFEKINCWFVNNSTSHESEDFKEFDKNNFEYQKETIRVDELLNILWLSNPRINTSLDNDDLIDIGLSSIVAYTLNDTLPKASIIRELDDNIQKYRTDDISDRDILNISTRISNRQLKNIHELNKIAETNTSEFLRKLKEEAQIQEKEENERVEKFDKLYEQFEKQLNSLDKAKSKIKAKEGSLIEKEQELEKEKQHTENEKYLINSQIDNLTKALEQEKIEKELILKQIRADKKEAFINKKVKDWRRTSWIQVAICVSLLLASLVYILYLSNWEFKQFDKTIKIYKENFWITTTFTFFIFCFTFYFLRNLREKYSNNSNIKAFRDLIEIPEDLKN